MTLRDRSTSGAPGSKLDKRGNEQAKGEWKERTKDQGISHRKYLKNVLLNGREIEALIDSGSDFSLIRADEYIKLGSSQLRSSELRFDGVGSNNTTLGEFEAKITVDGYSYPIRV
ncbi:hypothetical protein DMN91_002356 [Ooceraea biroi]|uniref:Peptidase A2 domain-containing protein n=1 Tax=Ooceraea biroi TaxID=2015173 RepID=A0A3L8E0F1_OOCBI|nr:hypothetical protein DMN91_002356 [Ooceraea biroi]